MTAQSLEPGKTPALDRLFNPRGIAVVGATSDLTRSGGQTIAALKSYGYTGGIYPVNPNRAEIAGLRCFRSLAHIDGDCDVAVIARPAAQVPGVMDECGARGIRYAVVIGAGFRESGPEGAQIEADMLARARAHGIRFVGPNGLGLVNVHANVYAAFGSFTRPPDFTPGAVSAVVQSGGFGNGLLVRCALGGVGFRYVVASGNETDLGAAELIDAYVDDPQTRVILAYLEGAADGVKFVAAARRALECAKPVIVWKGGKTRQGVRAAASHTASMTGTYDMYRAAFRECGVIEVDEMEEAAEFAQCLLAGRLPKGRDVALIGGSGGSSVVFSDTADEEGLELAPLADHTTAVVRASLPSIGSIRNPIDYTAGNPRPETRAEYARAFEAVLNDPGIHQLGVMFASAYTRQLEVGAEILRDCVQTCDKPVIAFSVMPEDIMGDATRILAEARIPLLRSPRRVARAMGMLADYAQALQRRDRHARALAFEALDLPGIAPGATTLDEREAKALLAGAGVSVTRDVVLPRSGRVEAAGLTFPVVAKILSRDIAHKSDVGGVRLGIPDAAALAAAASDMLANVQQAKPHAHVDGVLACEMVTDGVEMLVGVVNDPGFGPVVALGLGGVLTEVLNDVTHRIAPFTLEDARDMIAELKGSKILDGVRGKPPSDVEALARALVCISRLAWQLRDRLVELDVNPLIVRPKGKGAIAADALVVFRA
ncbi:MAG TPA: acetate--CoA ligase family protein [Burkholderiales bacterium]|nr:acetate--CoA ligase family protein [Burkholderiales bacterium]